MAPFLSQVNWSCGNCQFLKTTVITQGVRGPSICILQCNLEGFRKQFNTFYPRLNAAIWCIVGGVCNDWPNGGPEYLPGACSPWGRLVNEWHGKLDSAWVCIWITAALRFCMWGLSWDVHCAYASDAPLLCWIILLNLHFQSLWTGCSSVSLLLFQRLKMDLTLCSACSSCYLIHVSMFTREMHHFLWDNALADRIQDGSMHLVLFVSPSYITQGKQSPMQNLLLTCGHTCTCSQLMRYCYAASNL